MLEELKRQFSSIRILITLLIIAVGIYVFQATWQILGNFSDVIIILIASWLISFILEPIVEKVSSVFHVYKSIAALIVYILFLGLLGVIIFLFIPIVTAQIQELLLLLPKYLSSYPTFVNKWGDFMKNSLNNSLAFIPSVAQFFFLSFLTVIISFYFVLDKQKINDEFFTLLPKKWHKEVHFIQDTIDSSFSSFLRVQVIFALLSGIFTWIILRIFNIDFAASTAVMAGILTIVPLVGPVLAIIPPTLVALVTDPTRALFVFLVLIGLQQVIFNVIGPRLLGRAFKMHPVVVILSFLVGIKVAGGAGAVFAVPVLGILILVLHRLSRHFISST